MKNEIDTPIVVLGSKPNPSLPDVSTEVVFAANGAVEIALPYRDKYNSKIVGLVPAIELRKHKHIQESVKKADPDKMIVFGNDSDIVSFIRDDLGLPNTKVLIVTNRERQSHMISVIGWRIVFVIGRRIQARGQKIFLRKVADFFRKIVPDILLNRDKDWLMHSTGLDSIMYAMREFPERKIITAGIGLQGGAHFNNEGVFMSKTATADRGTMRHWSLSRRKNVYTTDEIMSKLGGVPEWKGDFLNIK